MRLNEAIDKMTEAAKTAYERFREDGFTVKIEIGYMNAFLATVEEPKKARFVTVTVSISTNDTEEGEEYCLSVGAEIRFGKIDDGQLEKDLAEFGRMVDETVERLRSYATKSEGISALAAEANAEYEKLVEKLREDQKKQSVISAIGMALFIVGIVVLFVVATFSA